MSGNLNRCRDPTDPTAVYERKNGWNLQKKHISPVLAGFRFYDNCFTQLLESLQQGKPRSSNIGPADSGTDADSIFILEKAGDPFMGPLAFCPFFGTEEGV